MWQLDVAMTAARRDRKTRATSPASRSNARRAAGGIVSAVRHHDIVRRREETTPVSYNGDVRLRVVKLGCFGGGTGLPSVLGGLKRNPWVDLHAIVTMFDTGGSSGQLRDELGVLPPGDVLKCALTLAQNEREARRLLLARLPMLTNGKLAGHTAGNLLLSMMEQYTGGDFLAAVDGLSALLGCHGHVWPITVERATLCAEHHDGSHTRGEAAVDAGQAGGRSIGRLWLEPPRGDPSSRGRRHSLAGRRGDRSRQFFHESAADLPRRRLPRRARRDAGTRSSTSRTC